MHNNVSVLRCHVIVKVTCSVTDAIDIDEVTSHGEQDAKEGGKVGEGREDTYVNIVHCNIRCVVSCVDIRVHSLPCTRLF